MLVTARALYVYLDIKSHVGRQRCGDIRALADKIHRSKQTDLRRARTPNNRSRSSKKRPRRSSPATSGRIE